MNRASILLSLALVVVAALPARGQDPTGAIEGVVTDGTSAAVAGARVVVAHLSTGLTRQTQSAPDGFFRVLLLPIGEYRVTVEAPRFGTVNQEPVPVTVGQTAHVNVRLELSSISETVTVTGGVQLVDTASNVLGRVVTGRGADTDTMVASAKAYVAALNKLMVKRQKTAKAQQV